MAIIEKARKWMEKYTGMQPKKEKQKGPTAASTRKEQGPGQWQVYIGDQSPPVVDGKGNNSPAKPL